MTALLCPLCSQPRFDNLESLRHQLVHAATQNIPCPICNDILVGLDKLTIHLFGHSVQEEIKTQSKNDLATLSNLTNSTQVETIETNEDIELYFDVPKNEVIDTKIDVELEKTKESCTVNLEDLSFLTSWENDLKYRQKNIEEAKVDAISNNDSNQSEHKVDNTELSEYMSELLNKKLPISNFIYCDDKIEGQTVVAEEHFETVTQTCQNIRCDSCNVEFENELLLKMHAELLHSKNEFVVDSPTISRNFSTNATQDFKTRVKYKIEHSRYGCHLCTKSFKMRGSLMLHYRVAHYGLNVPVNIPLVVGSPGSPSYEDKSYQCTICPKSFRKEQHLTQHIKTHDGKQWQCDTCSKHFTTKYFLKKHQRLHTGEMPYCCSACGKTFTFQQSYHKHLLYHSDEKPHECGECGRSFKELSTLHNHQRIHSGEKPFACPTCGKCFRQRVSYIVHQRIHTGVLPYQCTACKKKFRYKVSQRSHKCTSHPPGVVVKQTSDLIQRILEHRNTILQTTSSGQ